MDQMEDLASQLMILPQIQIQQQQKQIDILRDQIKWNDESGVSFNCDICQKSFYNIVALQNHKNLQHDGDETSSDEEIDSAAAGKLYPYYQNFNGLCGFKYVPDKELESINSTTEQNGLISRTFCVDTSYLVINVEGDELDTNAIKKKRLEGVVRRTHMKPGKQPVDLRGPFTCTFPSLHHPSMQCRQIFFNCCEYSLHYREEHTKRRKAALRCQVCEKRLDGDLYQGHPLAPQIHVPPNFSFSCRMCRQTFFDCTEYDEHNRTTHAKMKPHQCSICSKRFTQQGGLQQHMRMHTGIRPFPCTFCSKAFTQKAGLDQHLRTHTKIKPFKCVICTKGFSQSVHLRQHMRTHTNIQPFGCSFCGRRFKQSSHLNFHLRSHIDNADPSVLDRYAENPGPQGQMDFLNFSNLQPVHYGETVYYAAELPSEQAQQNFYSYENQVGMENNTMPLSEAANTHAQQP